MPATAPPPVCASCGACAAGCAACPVADTFYKARLPGGLRFLYNRSCDPPPDITTGGHVAVTHTSADAVGARGMWYYYAAGCSDVLLSLGRVLVASNGVDAALQLLRAAHPDSSAADAARRLAALKPTYVGRRVEQARRKLGPAHANASAEWLLLRAASLRQCRYRLRPTKVLWADRVGALATSVAVDDWWQDVAEELLLRLGYDTLALLEAPWMKNIAGNSGFWGTEIWDVRSLKGQPRRRDKFHDRNPGVTALRHNPRQVVRHLSIAGRRCAPARHFENCLACEGSELASVCAAEPERCRARAAAITKGDERKRAVVQCVGPSLK